MGCGVGGNIWEHHEKDLEETFIYETLNTEHLISFTCSHAINSHPQKTHIRKHTYLEYELTTRILETFNNITGV